MAPGRGGQQRGGRDRAWTQKTLTRPARSREEGPTSWLRNVHVGQPLSVLPLRQGAGRWAHGSQRLLFSSTPLWREGPGVPETLTLSSFDGWICSMSRWTIFSSLSHLG